MEINATFGKNKHKMAKNIPAPVRSISHTFPENHGKLGKRIEIGATAHVSLNKAGAKREFFTPTVECLIGIGKDHVAYLTMDEDAWRALKKGQKINIDSITTFKKNFL